MSRSGRASTELSALAAATVLRRAGRGVRLVHRAQLKHSGLNVPWAATSRVGRGVVAIMPLAAAPAALANPASHDHSQHHNPSAPPATIAHPARAAHTGRGAVGRTRLQRDLRRHRHVVLAAGNGYGTAAGSPLVRALQFALAHRGYAPGPMDGRYGPRTQGAVRRFQAALGLTIDGIAGPRTLGELTARIPVLHPGAGEATGGAAVVRALQKRLVRAGYSPGP